MTTQLRTTPATAAPSVKAARKATKDPADQTADQFAAMFTSLCLASSVPQGPAPAAKSQDSAAAEIGANLEIAGTDSTPSPPLAVNTLQGSALVVSNTAQGTAAKTDGFALPSALLMADQRANDVPVLGTHTEITAALASADRTPTLVVPLTPAPLPPHTAPAPPLATVLLSAQAKTAESTAWAPTMIPPPSAIEQPANAKAAELMSPTTPTMIPIHPAIEQLADPMSRAPTMNPTPPIIGQLANTKPADPIANQSALGATTSRFISGSAEQAVVAEDLTTRANYDDAVQTLQTEAARRVANLTASYLAETTRRDGEATAVVGVKTLLAGKGFDLRGDDEKRGSDFESQMHLLPGLLGKASFASTVRDFEAAGGASSVPSQTISQIMALAETMGAHQTRSLRLRLRPEELGQIDIQLSRDASGRISAHISAERESARSVLSQSLDQLRETLSRAGLTVDKLQISAGPGLFAGNRESDDAGSNTRESSSVVANLLTGNETEAGGQPRADDQKLLSLHA